MVNLGGLIGFLIVILVVVVVLWCVKIAVDTMTLPPAVKQIVLVLVSLVALIVVLVLALRMFGVAVVL